MITKETFDKLIEKDEILTKEEEYSIFEYYYANKNIENKNAIALKNIGLNKIYINRYKEFGGEFDDLWQEGFLGILEAVDKFDYTRDIKFSTYAAYWIKSYMSDLILDKYTVRMPDYFLSMSKAVNQFIEEYIEKYGKDPSNSYICKRFKISDEYLKLIFKYDNKYTLSLDYTYGNEEATSILDALEDELANVENIVFSSDLTDQLNKYLRSILSSRDYEIIAFRYGLNGSLPLSEKDTGKLLGMSEWKVKKKVREILTIIRSSDRIKPFKDYLINN